MEKEIIMVDQDEVISVDGFLYLINKFLGTNYTYEDFDGYYLQDKIPSELKDEFFKWFMTQNIYDHCELTPGCVEVLRKLNEKYKVFIGTSYIYPEIVNNCGYIVLQKFEFFQKHLPFITPYQYIFLADKSVLNADIKIDDRVDNLSGARTKLLFSAYHNLHYSTEQLQAIGAQRVDDWYDIERTLLRKRYYK